MRNIFVLSLSALLLPSAALAICSGSGTTLVYVNGITTSPADAVHDLGQLQKLLLQNRLTNIFVQNGYNPMHLDGLGDDIESVSQAFNLPISDYDLDTILAQIASEVTTRKLLLLGHSQGGFYTNELYDSLVKAGAPGDSIAVYNLAMPANFVAGGGAYLTSSNDKVINFVRGLDAQLHLPIALAANIAITQESGYAQDEWGGHIPSVYFNGAPGRIASDIKTAIAKLSGGSDTRGACYESPTLGLSYRVQKIALAVADPLVSAIDHAGSVINSAVSDLIYSIIPRPTVQNAAGVFAVEKALYGSSLSVADYEALLKGEDIPQVEPASEYQPLPPQAQPSTLAQNMNVPVQTVPDETASTTAARQQATTTTAFSIPPIVPIPALTPIFTSPGFGGGAPAPTVPQTSTAPVSSPSVEASSSPPLPNSGATSTEKTTDNAITSAATSTPPIDTSESTSTAATTTLEIASTTLDATPLTDSFDSGFVGWNNFASGWQTSDWSTSTADCYSGNCLSETSFNQQYENIKMGMPLSSGSFIVHFRNNRYLGSFGAGVCTIAGHDQCQSPTRLGGTDALLAYLLTTFVDNTWHYLYFAFRDGVSGYKEYCSMVDDAHPTHCSWSTPDSGPTVPNGTMYSGVVIYTGNGLNRGSSFYWDELKAANEVQ